MTEMSDLCYFNIFVYKLKRKGVSFSNTSHIFENSTNKTYEGSNKFWTINMFIKQKTHSMNVKLN